DPHPSGIHFQRGASLPPSRVGAHSSRRRCRSRGARCRWRYHGSNRERTLARTKRTAGSSRHLRYYDEEWHEAASHARDTIGTGLVIPVGGAEEKVGDITILRRFVKLCGGPAARIAIIPSASELDDTGDRYSTLFETLGAAGTVVLPITDRSHAMDPNHVRPLEEVDGIFLTGGNQLRLSTLIGGTDVSRAIRRRNAAGVHVAGTSAGAAFLCEHMI